MLKLTAKKFHLSGCCRRHKIGGKVGNHYPPGHQTATLTAQPYTSPLIRQPGRSSSGTCSPISNNLPSTRAFVLSSREVACLLISLKDDCPLPSHLSSPLAQYLIPVSRYLLFRLDRPYPPIIHAILTQTARSSVFCCHWYGKFLGRDLKRR